MEIEKQDILKKQKNRFNFLKEIYSHTGDNRDKVVVSTEINQPLDLLKDEVENILKYLQAEGLIKCLTMIYPGGSIPIQILHQGILEIESSMLTPDKPTEHFQTQVFINNSAPVAVQQVGNYSTSNLLEEPRTFQEAKAEGREEREAEMLRMTVPLLLNTGMTLEQIAAHLKVDIQAVRQAAQS